MTTKTFIVTVSNPGSGNRYYIDGALQATVSLAYGATYRFDQSDSSNANHPLSFSTTSDGTHGGGSAYVPGITVNGTPGSAGAYTEFFVTEVGPPSTMYYYCSNHSGMGGSANLTSNSWGGLSWGNGTWGDQGHIDVSLTGISSTSTIGTLASVTGDAIVQPSGIQLSLSQGTSVGGTSVLIEQAGISQTMSVGQVTSGIGALTSGMSMSSSIGSVTIDEESLTGAGWGRAAWGDFAWGVNYSVALTGQSLTSSIGNETAFTDITVEVTGQSMTSTQGIISLIGDFGIVVFAAEDQLDGSVGSTSITANADVTVTSAGELSTSIGQVVPEPKISVDVTGISATMTLGTFTLVQGTTEAVTGQQLTLSIGNAEQASLYPVSGLSLTGGVGDVTVIGTADIDVSGISMSISAGSIGTTAWAEVDPGVNNTWSDVDLAA